MKFCQLYLEVPLSYLDGKSFPPAVSFCTYHSNLCPLKSAACLLEGLSFLAADVKPIYSTDPIYWKHVGAFAGATF